MEHTSIHAVILEILPCWNQLNIIYTHRWYSLKVVGHLKLTTVKPL